MAGKKARTLTKQHYDLAKRLSSNGLSRGMIAQALGMHESTLYRRMEKDARLEAALKAGDDEDMQLCVNVLRERAMQGSAQHMDRYLQLRHGVYIGGARPNGFERREGPTIVVVPFQTGQAAWEHIAESEQGDTFENELIQNYIQDQSGDNKNVIDQ